MSEERKSLGQVAYETLQDVMRPVYGGEAEAWEGIAEEPGRTEVQSAFEQFAGKFRAEVLAREIEAAADKGAVA